MGLRLILATVKKDLKIFFSDRRAVMVSFLTPIVIASFFGFLFSGSGSGTSKIPVLVADRDNSVVSKALIKGLGDDPALKVDEVNEAIAREKVRKGKATVAVVIPKGFGYSSTRAFFNSAEKPELQLLYDPSHSAELGMVKGILTEYVMQSVSKEAFTGSTGRDVVNESLKNLESSPSPDMSGEDRKALEKLLGGVRDWQNRKLDDSASKGKDASKAGPSEGLSMPFTAKEEAVTSRVGVKYNGYAHSFGGMAIQFILFAAIELGMGILDEREKSLWKRFMVAPVSRSSLLMGKTAGGAVIAMMILFVTMGFGMVVFGIQVDGSWIGFLAICVASALMASSLGLFIAAVGRTTGATRGISIFAVLILVMLGGAWMPAFLFPAWLQKVTLLIPVRWAVDGIDAMTWRGVGLQGAIMPVVVLAAFTALFALLAVWRFKWEEA